MRVLARRSRELRLTERQLSEFKRRESFRVDCLVAMSNRLSDHQRIPTLPDKL